MKKKVLLLAFLAMCTSVVATGTLAYFTTDDTAHNVITSGNVEIELVETTDKVDANGDPVPFKNLSGVMPGMSVSKIVQVENTGDAAAYVRVKVDTAIKLATGSNGEPDMSLLHIDYDTDSWTWKDGYYYYNRALAPTELTAPLFETVEFDKDMGNLYQSSSAIIDVSAYATQVANNGDNVWEAEGWPEE